MDEAQVHPRLTALAPMCPESRSSSIVVPRRVGPPALSSESSPSSTKAIHRPVMTVLAESTGHHLQPQQKAVKRGFKSSRTPQVCGASFERLPAWLWTLRPSEWSRVLVSESDERRLRQVYPSLYSQFSNKFRVVAAPLGGDPAVSEAIVWWVSGSTDFANSLRLPAGVPSVQWVTGTSRRATPLTTPTGQWLNVSHSKVGGSTTSRGRFYINGLSSAIEIPQDLTRNIGHILKYSIRPKPCPPIVTFPHYEVSSKLSVHNLGKAVLVPSTFSSTGWGYRTIEPSELATAFELPDYLEWETSFAVDLLPLQILRCVMDALLDAQFPTDHPRGGQRVCLRVEEPFAAAAVDQEWVPSLQRWLAGTWALVPIADKAVKSDDAQVNVFPWHQRISLLFPCERTIFDRLTRFAMRRWRSNVIRSFVAYLNVQYGQEWRSLLSRKRARDPVVHRETVSETGGGSSFAAESTRRELIKDIQLGLPILGQVIQSSWWEWSSGSSLLFWRWNGTEQIKASRDGMKVYIKGQMPKPNG